MTLLEQSQTETAWATMARETFEFSVVPWAGRTYAAWLRSWTRPHPGDARGLVQLPEDMYRAFQKRTYGQRLSRRGAEELGYPAVPGERELTSVRKELHDALLRCDWDQAHDLDRRLRDLQERVAATRTVALKRSAIGS
jgi:hypothetical protein